MPMSSITRRRDEKKPCLRLGVAGIVAAVLLSFSVDARARADADDTHVAQQFAQLVAETISASLGGPAMGALADEIRTVSTCLSDRARPVEPSVPTDDPITAVGCFAAVLSAGRAAAELVVDALPIGRLLALLALEMRPHDPAAPHPAPTGRSPFSAPSPGAVVAPTNGRITSTFGDGRGHQGLDIGNDLGAPIFAVTDGEVINSGPAQGFGLWVRIRHADGTITTYGHNPERRERVALRVIAFSFFALAAYVSVDSIRTLLGVGSEAEHSSIGIVLAAVSLAIMPLLSWAERRAGRELGSVSAVADSKQTLLCTYLSAVLLVGLLLNSLFGWSLADPPYRDRVPGLAVERTGGDVRRRPGASAPLRRHPWDEPRGLRRGGRRIPVGAVDEGSSRRLPHRPTVCGADRGV